MRPRFPLGAGETHGSSAGEGEPSSGPRCRASFIVLWAVRRFLDGTVGALVVLLWEASISVLGTLCPESSLMSILKTLGWPLSGVPRDVFSYLVRSGLVSMHDAILFFAFLAAHGFLLGFSVSILFQVGVNTMRRIRSDRSRPGFPNGGDAG